MENTTNMTLQLKVWRQAGANTGGGFRDYTVENVSPDMSFLEMLDVLNEKLIKSGEAPIAFEHDCREGICGSCSMMVNGCAHGPESATTVCQLHMRKFNHGDSIVVEPWRAKAFPVVKDLVVDRSAFDRIISVGGFITTNTGSAQDGNAVLIGKTIADQAMDAAACIGCGACVAACKNASASLFTAAKVSHLSLLPQGSPEREKRVMAMVEQMDREGFGSCSNTGACEAACPKSISVENIARMNKEYFKAFMKKLCARQKSGSEGGHG